MSYTLTLQKGNHNYKQWKLKEVWTVVLIISNKIPHPDVCALRFVKKILIYFMWNFIFNMALELILRMEGSTVYFMYLFVFYLTQYKSLVQ